MCADHITIARCSSRADQASSAGPRRRTGVFANEIACPAVPRSTKLAAPLLGRAYSGARETTWPSAARTVMSTFWRRSCQKPASDPAGGPPRKMSTTPGTAKSTSTMSMRILAKKTRASEGECECSHEYAYRCRSPEGYRSLQERPHICTQLFWKHSFPLRDSPFPCLNPNP